MRHKPFRRSVPHVLLCSIGLLAAMPAPIDARQTTPVAARQTTPVAASCGDPFPGEFTLLNGARELDDGRLVVSDWIENEGAILDFDAGTSQTVGSFGSGPAEFRAPGGLLSFRGDSTLLVDLGNTRFAVIGPRGRIARTVRAEAPGLLGTGGADGSGRLYYVEPGWAAGLPPTSAAPRRLLAYDPGTGATVEVARVDVARPRSDAGEPRTTPGIPFVVFAARDGWAVGDDGSVALVHADPFRIEWLRNGARVSGEPLEIRPRQVTDDDRRRFVRDFFAAAAISGRGADGGLGQAPPLSPEELREIIDTNDFADAHAPFDPSHVQVAPDGRAWVVSTPPTRTPVQFEVFDVYARHVGSVELPEGLKPLHVGRRQVYAIRTDEFGLQSILRCRIPV